MNEATSDICSINDLRLKEVINLFDGARLGSIDDALIDLSTGRLTALTLPGNYKLMGFLGREEDKIIKWEDIKKIGDDVIIIDSKQH